jgi:hypothetical protein
VINYRPSELYDRLHRCLFSCVSEFDMSNAEVLGVLRLLSRTVEDQALEDEEPTDGEDV